MSKSSAPKTCVFKSPARRSPVAIHNVWALQPYCLEFAVNGIPVRLTRHRNPSVYLLNVASSVKHGMADFLHSPSIALKADPAVLQTIWRTASLVQGRSATPADMEACDAAVPQLRWDSELGAHMEVLREWGERLSEYHSALYRVEAVPAHIIALKKIARSGRKFLVEIRSTLDDGKGICHYSEFVVDAPSKKELRLLFPEGIPADRVRTVIRTIEEYAADCERELAKDRETVQNWESSADSARPVFPGEFPLELPETVC